MFPKWISVCIHAELCERKILIKSKHLVSLLELRQTFHYCKQSELCFCTMSKSNLSLFFLRNISYRVRRNDRDIMENGFGAWGLRRCHWGICLDSRLNRVLRWKSIDPVIRSGNLLVCISVVLLLKIFIVGLVNPQIIPKLGTQSAAGRLTL